MSDNLSSNERYHQHILNKIADKEADLKSWYRILGYNVELIEEERQKKKNG